MKNQLFRSASVTAVALALVFITTSCTGTYSPPLWDGASTSTPVPVQTSRAQSDDGPRLFAARWPDLDRASCISVFDSVAPAEAVALVAEDATPLGSDLAEADTWAYDSQGELISEFRSWIAAGTIGDTTFVWEDNGFACSDRATMERASLSGSVASMYWNADAATIFTYAKYGLISVQTDDLSEPTEEQWPILVKAGATRMLAGLWDQDPERGGLIVQAELFGLSAIANPEWLDREDVRFWGVII